MNRTLLKLLLKPLPERLKSSAMVLILVLLIGLGLRLWHLDLKPLWLDEVLTALFTMGRSYQDVPLNQFFPLTRLNELFTVQPGLSCGDITRRITTESVHPPVFFCLLYAWMSWLQPENWGWGLRILPALFGVAAIAAIAWLNQVAFSARAGLRAAALMAVSPFAVYLSQEARHYTLPMLLVTLALVMLVKMQQDLIEQNRLRPTVWTSWTLLNLLGLYTHYFCILALVAQVVALSGWMVFNRRKIARRFWIAWGIALAGVTVGYLPWVPTVINHFTRPETDWLIPYKPDWLDRLEPLYQTLVGWTLMVIALPVENQPTGVAVGLGLLVLGFMLWLIWQVRRGATRLWQQTAKRPALLLLLGFTGCVLLQFFAIVYLLNKDLTVVPRYNFIYYPGVCALLAACLGRDAANPARPRHPIKPVLLAGLVSSLFVVQGWVFQKSYQPDQVARNMRFEPDQPLAGVMTYRSPQEVGLGLSFALALQQQTTADDPIRFAFLDRSQSESQAWDILSELPQPLPPPLNLWIVGSPGMRTGDYPQRLTLNAPATPTTRPKMRCEPDPEKLYRRGFPYQLFRCAPLPRRNG